MLKLCHHDAYQRIQDFLEVFLKFFQHKIWYKLVSKKYNPVFVRGQDRKFFPHDHHLSSVGNLVMTIGDPWGVFFYPNLTLMMDSYNIVL